MITLGDEQNSTALLEPQVDSVPAEELKTQAQRLAPYQSVLPDLQSSSELEAPIRSLPVISGGGKRIIDILGAATALILFSPLLLAVALLVKITSRGPVLFSQLRCGLGAKQFNCYKFRTMIDGAHQKRADLFHKNEMKGPIFKLRNDPRITRLGRFLRLSSLDELPQLWNVLRGEMSLVGPRPPTPCEVEHYTAEQMKRLSVRPGLTGLWQVSGRSSIADFHHWVELDLEYIEKWSLWLDLKILLKTIPAVLSTKGAW
jgi:exopolysaccharide biosynthesis polyprenyl glycosylphosphotransferase